jgi:hypothetical protein
MPFEALDPQRGKQSLMCERLQALTRGVPHDCRQQFRQAAIVSELPPRFGHELARQDESDGIAALDHLDLAIARVGVRHRFVPLQPGRLG